MHVRSILSGCFKSYSVSQRVQLIAAAIPTSKRHRTVRTAASWLVPIAVVLSTLISAEPWLSAQALPPTVSSVYPSGYPGENLPTVVIRGSAFQSGALCNFGADITVNSCTFNSSAQLTANVVVSLAAALNFHPITVTNPDGQSGTLTNGFLVGSPPKPSQVATFSFHPSSSGIVTVTLPNLPRQRSTLIVGVSFWPADITSVNVNELGSGQTDVLRRGLATSLFHEGPGGPFYTNFYYGPNHGYQLAGLGPDTLTLNFSGGATDALIAVAEVSGLACLDCHELDQSAYNESLSPAASWSSGSATTTAFDEYLFSWGATEASNSTCSSPGNGWTLESQTNDPSGASVCLLDQFVEPPGLSYQASVNASPAANYGMEVATFAKQIPSAGLPAVTSVNPSFGTQGQSLPTVVIAGSGFDSTTVCSFGAGITVNSCTLNSPSQLVAKITIESTAAMGLRNVTVTSVPDSNTGTTLPNAFSVTPGGSAPDFTIDTSTASQASLDGGTAIYSVVLKESNGFKQPVTLTCGALPAGMTCSAPPPITPTASGVTATITVNVPAALAASANAHSFTITGTSGSLSHSVPAQLFVATLNGTIAPSAATIQVGSSANFTVSLTATDSFAGPVSLNCAGLAPGLRCVYPSPVAVPGSATLAVFVDAKPMSSSVHTGSPDLWPDAWVIALAIVFFLLLATMAVYRRKDVSPAGVARGFAALALVLVLAVGLVSCGGATKSNTPLTAGSAGATAGTGSGGSGGTSGTAGSSSSGGTGGTGGGGSNSITTQFAVQAQSSGATVNLGTISITVP